MAAQERVAVEVRIGAAAEDVWHALRDPERIRHWFGWDEYGLDEEIRYIFADAVTADDDARALEWEDGDRLEVHEVDGDAQVRVVRVTGAGEGVFDPIDEGWATFVQQLRYLLERHAGKPRRTVVADHVDLGAGGELLRGLGLDGLGDVPVGGRWELDHLDGTRVGGEVLFRTENQLGLTVEQEGDALLVVSRTPASVEPPHGTARFVLSLYDVDDERAVDTADRWHAWIGA